MSQEKKKALGRGLESLLPKPAQAVKAIVSGTDAGNGKAAAIPPTGAVPESALPTPHAHAAHGGNGAAAVADAGNGKAATVPAGAIPTLRAEAADGGNGAAKVAEVVAHVAQQALVAAANGDGGLGEVSRMEALVALADATRLDKDLVLKAAASAVERYTPEYLATYKITPGEMVIQLPLTMIGRNPYQTRFTSPEDPGLLELAESIRVHGVLQPVVVTPHKQEGPTGQLYHLIAGERRWLASSKAGKTHIPAIVRVLAPAEIAVLTIIENLLRQDLNPMQHARAFQRLAEDFRLTQEEIAQRTGLSRPAVTNYLRMNKLPEFAQRAIEEGRLSFGHAKVLAQLGMGDGFDLCAKRVMAGRMTVRETEQLVQEYLRPPIAAEKPERKVDPNVRAAEEEMARQLGCRVLINDRGGKGKIVIEYRSLEDFDRVIEALK